MTLDSALAWLASIDWGNLFGSFLISLAASFLFWALSFKISRTDVRFSTVLEKSDSAQGLPYHRYRVRFSNLGRRDLIEVSIAARMIIRREKHDDIMYLNCGARNFHPMLRHRPGWFSKKPYQFPLLTLSPSDGMRSELTKAFYTDRIRTCARNQKISLDDIFDEYGENVFIQIFLYGNDRVTGSRRLFLSPVYTIADLREGRFCPTKGVRFSPFTRKKDIQAYFSQVLPPSPKT